MYTNMSSCGSITRQTPPPPSPTSQHKRQINPEIVFLCDPVLGDNGQLYVPKELIPIFRDELIPLADIITPNQFEIETLTGKCTRSDP